MPARVTILCGPARSGKTERLLARYRETLANGPLGSALWLAPTWRAATEVRERLLEETLAGCFSPGVMTFGNFAEDVLRAAELPIRPMTRLMKRELVRQILFEQSSRGRLGHFQSIANTTGLGRSRLRVHQRVEASRNLARRFPHRAAPRAGWPTRTSNSRTFTTFISKSCGSTACSTPKAASGRPATCWQEKRGESRDESGERRTAEGWALPCPVESGTRVSLVVADGFTDFTRTQHEILAILASRAKEMFVTLPLETAPRRDDLFAKPLKTLDELRRRHPGATVEQLDRSHSAQLAGNGALGANAFRESTGSRGMGDGEREAGATRQFPRPLSPAPRPLSLRRHRNPRRGPAGGRNRDDRQTDQAAAGRRPCTAGRDRRRLSFAARVGRVDRRGFRAAGHSVRVGVGPNTRSFAGTAVIWPRSCN